MSISDISQTIRLDCGNANVDMARETLGMLRALLTRAYERTAHGTLSYTRNDADALHATISSPVLHASVRAEIGGTIQRLGNDDVRFTALTATAQHDVLMLQRAERAGHELRFWLTGIGLIAGAALIVAVTFLISAITSYVILSTRLIVMGAIGGASAGAWLARWAGERYYDHQAARVQTTRRSSADLQHWEATCALIRTLLHDRHLTPAVAAPASAAPAPPACVFDLRDAALPEPDDTLRTMPQFLRVRAAVARLTKNAPAAVIGNRRMKTAVACARTAGGYALILSAHALTPAHHNRLSALLHHITPHLRADEHLAAISPEQNVHLLANSSLDALAALVLAIQHRVFELPHDAVMPIEYSHAGTVTAHRA